MEIMTFNEILTKLCDDFDELIKPRKIARSNTNIIYLLFKAIAKGYEVIHNICVTLSHKFDPANCSDEDLVSVASLVGTERRTGSATGLHIVVTNTADVVKTLSAGIYTYSLDDDTVFEFEVTEDTDIEPNSAISYIAMSRKIGVFPVTAQVNISIESEQDIDSKLAFSCTDNANLLGQETETLLAFRKRVLNTYDRQNRMVEMEEYLRNLPYLFDCRVKYNQTDDYITLGDIVIPPMSCAIFFSGEVKNDIAEKVADYIICPTVATENSVEVRYINSVFADGYYAVNLIPFDKTYYSVDIIYTAESEYINVDVIKEEIEKTLLSRFVGEKHEDIIKEDDIYNVTEEINHSGLNILAINLKVNNEAVDYVSVPLSNIPELTNVTFIEG